MTDERKRLLRTALQVSISLAAAAPFIVDAVGLNPTIPIVAGILSASLGVTRLMAVPAVEKMLPEWLRR